MTEILSLLLPFAGGLFLGGLFFSGLWWTVRKGLASPRPGLRFFCSYMLRMLTVLAGMYFIAGSHWQRLFACLLGCLTARQLAIRLSGRVCHDTATPQEAGHANQP